MKHNKSKLLKISKKIAIQDKLTPEELATILSFQRIEREQVLISLLKKAAVPLALVLGFLLTVYPEESARIVDALPRWTNLPTPAVRGADYIWNIIGEPVGKNSILYHLPNIILYSFGVLGIKKLFDAIDRKTWVDAVNKARNIVLSQMDNGTLALLLGKGHSALFLGRGDFIGMQFVLNNPDGVVVIGEIKPGYTSLWNYYQPDTGYDDLKAVIERTCNRNTGEYIFFPVKDDQIFLPGPSSYDLSPHKLDILCQDIRTIERKNKWKTKKIIVVGDRFHTSFVQSEGKNGKVKQSEDIISLQTISQKYENVTLIDPTDIVLERILEIANRRKIVFRATKEGINEYKKRFFFRLEKLGYKDDSAARKGVLTIGYDIFEDQTEQQTLSRKIDDYYPVVLSKSVRDALVRNGYKVDEFIYVPDLVLRHLGKKASEQ